MITPLFRLSQDEEYLYVTLVVPNMRLNDEANQIYYEERQFFFHASPYFLRLDLPGEVKASESIQKEEEEGDTAAATTGTTAKKTIYFDAEKGELVVPVEKAVAGEHFTGLEALGRLLSGPKSRLSRRLVEVLQEKDAKTPLIEDLAAGGGGEEEEEEEDFDWNIEQKLPAEDSGGGGSGLAMLLGLRPYGFANRYSGVLERLGPELAAELVDIPELGQKSRGRRRALRVMREEADFDEDHYVADMYEQFVVEMEEEFGGGGGSRIEEIIAAEAPWNTAGKWRLTDEDRLRLIEHIPRRGSLPAMPPFEQSTTKVLLLGLADLLFAYAYDLRTTDWEHSSESAWTVRKLSPTLSCFEYWATTKEEEGSGVAKVESRKLVLASLVRRSLIYPLYRNWRLAVKVAQDVVAILGLGQAAVLKCLIDMHRLFNQSGGEGEHLYLLNDLYIVDYIAWLQQLKGGGEKLLTKFAQDLNQVLEGTETKDDGIDGQGRGPQEPLKKDVGLELELIERAAAEMVREAIKKVADKEAGEDGPEDQLCQRTERAMRLAAGGEDDDEELDSDDDEEPPTTSQQ